MVSISTRSPILRARLALTDLAIAATRDLTDPSILTPLFARYIVEHAAMQAHLDERGERLTNCDQGHVFESPIGANPSCYVCAILGRQGDRP